MLSRITSVLSGALRGSQLQHLSQEWEISTALGRARSLVQPPDPDLEKAAQEHGLQQMAFFHMSKPPEMGDPRGLPAHEAAVAVAEIRTDPDAQSARSASDSPLPIGASVALSVLVLGAAGLYAVKLRHG